jgi:hypothetical protein
MRAVNMIWVLARPADAAAILAELAALGGTEDENGAERAGRMAVEACVDAIGARCADSEEKARAAIDSGELSDLNAFMAALALVMSAGASGMPPT